MLCIHLKETDPWFCLAAEEFLLKNHTEDIFMIWQSEDTVVAGKHQNMLGEVNYRYVRENGIRLARRISGGGTVFHDRGNVNFTYIRNVSGPQEISFSRFTEPVRGALGELGVVAETSGRNDLLVKGKKVSGNAEHVFKNRVLHHGTLLFDADLAMLGQAIRVVPGAYQSKAVPSNRSAVANISEFLPSPMTIDTFIAHIFGYQLSRVASSQMYTVPEEERREIALLAETKFKTPEWTFSYSPAYTFSRTSFHPEGPLEITLHVEKGIIVKAAITGDYYGTAMARRLEGHLEGIPHLYESLLEKHQILGMPSDPEILYSYF